MNPQGNKVLIPTTTASTSPTTGALIVGGGIGVGGDVYATSFHGSGSSLTGVQMPITLTTTGTSGAATFSGNTLNVPNYGSGTGGSFSSSYTNISNTSQSLGLTATYMSTGSATTIGVHGGVISTASGKCTFRLSLPTITSSYLQIVVNGSDSSKTSAVNAWVEGSSTNYVDISFIAGTSSSSFVFSVMAIGY